MAKLPRTINTNDLSKPEEFSLLPKGSYNVIISKTDYKCYENNKEQIIITCKVMDGAYANRILNVFITMVYPIDPNTSDIEAARSKKETVENISSKLLFTLMTAAGVSDIDDTDELLNKKVVADVVVNPGKNGYQESNSVSRFKEYKGDTLPPQTSAKAWGNVPKQTSEVSEGQVAPGPRPW